MANGVISAVNVNDGNYKIASSAYGICSTAASTTAKTVAIDGFALVDGVTIHVKFSTTNSAANPTLNVNGTGAKGLKQYGTTSFGTNVWTSGWSAGAVIALTYDGTNWVRDYGFNTDGDTKNTTGSTQSANKLFLVGATAQASSTQTYSHTAVYATDGAMAATSYKVAEAVNLQYNATTQALDFVFI